MDRSDLETFFKPSLWYVASQGPRYLQLCKYIGAAIRDGRLPQDLQLPPERELAAMAEVSRVTIRKAVAELVNEQVIERHHGSGSFVRPAPEKVEHRLSALTSFTEYMSMRGYRSNTINISSGVHLPHPDEAMALGLPPGQQVARLRRLRSADGVPMAIEVSVLPTDILPDPDEVAHSLYEVLRERDCLPVRAIQRISAIATGSHSTPARM